MKSLGNALVIDSHASRANAVVRLLEAERWSARLSAAGAPPSSRQALDLVVVGQTDDPGTVRLAYPSSTILFVGESPRGAVLAAALGSGAIDYFQVPGDEDAFRARVRHEAERRTRGRGDDAPSSRGRDPLGEYQRATRASMPFVGAEVAANAVVLSAHDICTDTYDVIEGRGEFSFVVLDAGERTARGAVLLEQARLVLRVGLRSGRAIDEVSRALVRLLADHGAAVRVSLRVGIVRVVPHERTVEVLAAGVPPLVFVAPGVLQRVRRGAAMTADGAPTSQKWALEPGTWLLTTDGLVGSEGEEVATQGLVSRLRLDTFGGALTRSPPHQLGQLVREALEELGSRRDDTCVALVHVGAAGVS